MTALKQQPPASQPATNTLAGHFACMTSVAMFAVGFPAADRLLADWGAISLIAFRNAVGLILLIVLWLAIDGWNTVRTAPWLKGIRIGSVGFGLGATLLLVAQSMTNAVTAVLAAATMPVAAVALEVFFDGRKLTAYFLTGVALVLAGGFLATGMSVNDASFGLGAIVGLLASTFFAWGSRATVKSLPEMTPLGKTVVTTAGMSAFCIAAFMLFYALGLPGTEYKALNAYSWMLMLIYAWVSLAISQVFWITGVGKLGVGIASFHLNAGPFYVMLILLVIGGAWNWQQAIGAGILALGVIMAHKTDTA